MNSLATRGNYLLASVLAGDALMSIKPPKFISRCLNGVNFPKDCVGAHWNQVARSDRFSHRNSEQEQLDDGNRVGRGFGLLHLRHHCSHQSKLPRARILG